MISLRAKVFNLKCSLERLDLIENIITFAFDIFLLSQSKKKLYSKPIPVGICHNSLQNFKQYFITIFFMYRFLYRKLYHFLNKINKCRKKTPVDREAKLETFYQIKSNGI